MNKQNPLINNVDLYLKTFCKVLSKPQFVHFEQIIKGTLFKERKSINSYSKSSLKHQTPLSRFVNSKAVKFDKIFNVLHQEIDFIIDDTIKHHKYGKHIYILSRHHNHLNDCYSIGHNLVIAGIRQNNDFQPTNFELYQRQVDVSKTSTFKTKINMTQAMLDE